MRSDSLVEVRGDDEHLRVGEVDVLLFRLRRGVLVEVEDADRVGKPHLEGGLVRAVPVGARGGM